MYYEHFGFQLPPFSISPDPRFLYLSERHRDALAHLIYGAGENGGFVLLTGQVGTGKTTLIRSLLAQELPDIDIALCLHSGLSVNDFIASILDELRVEYPKDASSLKPLVDALNAHLLKRHAEGRQTVLIIDEGQNLSREVLEQVRLLTNLETDSQKLLRIILVGQEELQDIINRPDLRQLSQRITGRYHLTSLNAKEVSEYITHRIKTAKGNPSIFTAAAVKQAYRFSNGIPRLINVLCDRALLVAYNSDNYRVAAKHIKIAATETLPQASNQQSQNKRALLVWATLPLGVLAITGFAYTAQNYLKNLPEKSNTRIALNNQSEEQPSVSVKATASENIARKVNAEIKQAAEPKPQLVAAKSIPHSVIKGTELEETTRPSSDTIHNPTHTNLLPLSTTNELATIASSESNAVATDSSKEEPLAKVGVNQAEGVKALLKRWNLPVEISANQTVCEYAESHNMSCLTVRGGMPLVKKINRPVLLELSDIDKNSWLPIIGFDSNSEIICSKKGIPQTCKLGEISRYWTGNFIVLLKKPAVSVKLLPGFEGEQIKWLRQRIAIAENRDVRAISPSLKFDSALEDKVKAFQKSRNINIDGLIGNDTLLYLHNVVIDSKTPILHAGD